MGLSIAIEEVAKYSNAPALILLLTRLATGPLQIALTEDQKMRYLPGIANGSLSASFALSEPGAGSDAVGMRTVALPDPEINGGWVLDGVKCWISGIAQAGWFTVFVKTGPAVFRKHDSITAFVLDRDLPRVSIGWLDRKMGVHGVDTGELILDHLRVGKEAVIGEVGGFRLAMLSLSAMRPIVAARGLGLAEVALMYAVDNVKRREVFGKTIAAFQGIQWEISKLTMKIEAARLLRYRAAMMADNGQFGKNSVPQLSVAKYFATEIAVRASSLAVQLLGAQVIWKITLWRCFIGMPNS